jgi:hypothetical protein
MHRCTRGVRSACNQEEFFMTDPSPKTLLRWAAYARSRSRGSCESQLAKCLELPKRVAQAKAAPEAALCDVGGVSLPNLTNLLAMAHSQKIDLLVVSDTTRLKRYALSVEKIADAFKDTGTGLYAMVGGWLVYPKILNVNDSAPDPLSVRLELARELGFPL